MFHKNKKISGTNMLLLGSLFLAAPIIGSMMGRKKQEERENE